MSDKQPSKAERFQETLLKISNPELWFGRKKKPQPGGVRYAGFNDRVFSGAIDIMLIMLVLGRLFFWMSRYIHGDGSPDMLLLNAWNGEGGWQAAYRLLIGNALSIMVNNTLQVVIVGALFVPAWHCLATTPGKWLLRMRVVDAETLLPLSIGRSIKRYVFLVLLALPFGYLWVCFDKRHQAWHDKLAGSVVIKVTHWRLSKGVDTTH